MKKRERQRLETQLQRLKVKQAQLAEDITHTARQLRAAERYERQKQLLYYGELVELAALAQLDLGTLLGGLCDLRQRLHDPGMSAKWKAAGEPLLVAYLQRKWHRKQRSSPVASDSATNEQLA